MEAASSNPSLPVPPLTKMRGARRSRNCFSATSSRACSRGLGVPSGAMVLPGTTIRSACASLSCKPVATRAPVASRKAPIVATARKVSLCIDDRVGGIAISYLCFPGALVRQVNIVFFQRLTFLHSCNPFLRADHGCEVGMEYRAENAVDFFGAGLAGGIGIGQGAGRVAQRFHLQAIVGCVEDGGSVAVMR